MKTETYYVVGTYADGVVRKSHVTTTSTPAQVVARVTIGFLPFQSADVMPCVGKVLDCRCDHVYAAVTNLRGVWAAQKANEESPDYDNIAALELSDADSHFTNAFYNAGGDESYLNSVYDAWTSANPTNYSNRKA